MTYLYEHHEKGCTCSYCHGEHKLKNGLNLPANKSWNSWRIIKIGRRYFRWTLPKWWPA